MAFWCVSPCVVGGRSVVARSAIGGTSVFSVLILASGRSARRLDSSPAQSGRRVSRLLIVVVVVVVAGYVDRPGGGGGGARRRAGRRFQGALCVALKRRRKFARHYAIDHQPV